MRGEEQRRQAKHKYRLAMWLLPMPIARPDRTRHRHCRYPHIETIFVQPASQAYLAATGPNRTEIQTASRRDFEQFKSKGDNHVEEDSCTGRDRSTGCGIRVHFVAAGRGGRRMRARSISWTGRRLPPVRIRTIPRRLQWPLSRRVSLERLSGRLLARPVGTLPGHPLSRSPAQRFLEIVSGAHHAGSSIDAASHGTPSRRHPDSLAPK